MYMQHSVQCYSVLLNDEFEHTKRDDFSYQVLIQNGLYFFRKVTVGLFPFWLLRVAHSSSLLVNQDCVMLALGQHLMF